jgi:tRNA(fMet)-specific endonuclease VapC
VLIDAERDQRALEEAIADDDDVAIAAITAAELLVGVELASEAHRKRRTSFVARVLETVPVETYGLEVARAHARLLAMVQRTGRPRGAHDLIIAATAVTTARTVLTADGSGFSDLEDVELRLFG